MITYEMMMMQRIVTTARKIAVAPAAKMPTVTLLSALPVETTGNMKYLCTAFVELCQTINIQCACSHSVHISVLDVTDCPMLIDVLYASA